MLTIDGDRFEGAMQAASAPTDTENTASTAASAESAPRRPPGDILSPAIPHAIPDQPRPGREESFLAATPRYQSAMDYRWLEGLCGIAVRRSAPGGGNR